MDIVSPLFALLILQNLVAGFEYSGNKETPDHWNNIAKGYLEKARRLKPNIAVAKNVIIFIGDGMGVSTVTASRILKGQMKNHTGEEEILSFETFPHVALSKTYNQDGQTPDSAGTATAYYSGIKTNRGILGLDARSRRGVCASENGTKITSIMHWSQAAGKSVGLVTSTRVTHATPGALYAHTAERNWESDTDKLEDSDTDACTDIARQLVVNNKDINVIFGGGRSKFMKNNTVDPESGPIDDGRQDEDLIALWERQQNSLRRSHKYVWNKQQFDSIPDDIDNVLGLFEASHMKFEVDRDPMNEPSLAEMTSKAIKILKKNSKGFFLLVEGGRIDHGHHLSQAVRALHDTLAFEEAVQRAMIDTSESDTLIVVTADHSHVFTMGGYPTRGNPIFGLTDDDENNSTYKLGKDGKPMTTLGYTNGPGGYAVKDNATVRPDLSQVDTANKDFRQQSGVPLTSETHGGEDVTIYARGPMSHLFHSVHEQNYIAHVMAYASCVGGYSDANSCAMADVKENTNTSSGCPTLFSVHSAYLLVLAVLLYTSIL